MVQADQCIVGLQLFRQIFNWILHLFETGQTISCTKLLGYVVCRLPLKTQLLCPGERLIQASITHGNAVA